MVLSAVLMAVLMSSVSFAQMGGMTGGPKGEPGGMGMMQQKGRMSGGMMAGDMTALMGKMSEMMGKTSDMIKEMPPEKMKRMTPLLRDMAHQMLEMSRIMDRGFTTESEMKRLHDRVGRMRKLMSELEKK